MTKRQYVIAWTAKDGKQVWILVSTYEAKDEFVANLIKSGIYSLDIVVLLLEP